MEQLLEAIRSAVAADTTDEVRAAGATACRTILIALEAKPGQQLAAPSALPADTSPIATIVAGLRGVPPEQLLDLAIARLRAALPADAAVPNVAPVRFQILPMAPLAATVGSKARS